MPEEKKNLTPEEVRALLFKQYEAEREELLRRSKENNHLQLQFDGSTGGLREVDELRQLNGQQFENPQEKYWAYYMGIQKVLKTYLPSGKNFKEARDIIYDEKNVFLNLGKKKSDNNGIRGSDGRMTYQPVLNEIVDLLVKWVAESQNPFTLYNMLYDLNEQHGYGHEVYDGTALRFAQAMRTMKED
jgi:hypothetical protein